MRFGSPSRKHRQVKSVDSQGGGNGEEVGRGYTGAFDRQPDNHVEGNCSETADEDPANELLCCFRAILLLRKDRHDACEHGKRREDAAPFGSEAFGKTRNEQDHGRCRDHSHRNVPRGRSDRCSIEGGRPGRLSYYEKIRWVTLRSTRHPAYGFYGLPRRKTRPLSRRPKE